MRTTVLCLAAVLSMASAAKPTYKSQEYVAPDGVTHGDLYGATISVFTDLGFSLRDNDTAGGVVTTQWVQLVKTGTNIVFEQTPPSHSWRAMITEGTFRLAIDCMGCSGSERDESWIKREPEIREAIFDEAHRRATMRWKRSQQQKKPAATTTPAAPTPAPAEPAVPAVDAGPA